MKKLLSLIFVAVVLLNAMGTSTASEKAPVTLEQLNKMFANMRSSWGDKVDGELLWGYFFTDNESSKLEPVADLLAKSGYRVVKIYRSEKNAKYFLHVEKVEHHTAASLNQRNLEFYKLADDYHLNSYDGMDVGPAGK